MARKVFYSFRYKLDSVRVSQVKNIGVVEGSPLLSSNDWEDVKKGGDTAIQNWIDNQLKGRDALVVLIGAETAGRKWVKYEIKKSWNDKKGVLGINIHNLKDFSGAQSLMGNNPFGDFKIGDKVMSNVVKTYNPNFTASTDVYRNIADNLASWVEEAITIRAQYTALIS